MIPTWDHRNPAQVREKARFEVLNQYGSVRIEDVEVTAARMSNDSLSEVTDSNSRAWKGKKIIQATGSANIFPDIPGYADCWAKRINLNLKSDHLHPRLGGSLALRSRLPGWCGPRNSSGWILAKSRISAWLRLMASRQAGVSLTFADGTSVIIGFLVHNPFTKVQGPFVEQLGNETATLGPVPEVGDIVANFPAYQTSIRSVSAAGDCITQYKVIADAISSGCNAALAAPTQLLAEKYQHEWLVWFCKISSPQPR
ncbi:thioredoxin reductase [Blastomyces dermatitidis ER-3]|uniref:Thioredoxin reductase n=2 Tax=Ajellomyces dermatitidis TaxID=5039 RepID=F2T3Q8_AJEDA|nr:thioredoxin reductase [Blastomyces dermatitidis ER-3]EEQ87358.2 thioredoxin reductase [Blastomyces dermatitidis ER-3]EGE78060.2 thioredoxin reductase [Blastomyces dermatitidis ATCC 18188]